MVGMNGFLCNKFIEITKNIILTINNFLCFFLDSLLINPEGLLRNTEWIHSLLHPMRISYPEITAIN